MSAGGHAIPTPRVLRLRRVKLRIKRPRWPRGSKVWLMLAVLLSIGVIVDLVKIALGNYDPLGAPLPLPSPWLSTSVWEDMQTDVPGCVAAWYVWWRSRGGGPSAT